jgi:signal transduction histidine kinase
MTITDILRTAIAKEQESYAEYLQAADEAPDTETKQVLLQLAEDELRHVEVLQAELAQMAGQGDLPATGPVRSRERTDVPEESCEVELEGVKRAVTVLAEAKRELESLRQSKEDFYAMVTHDMRAPLVSLVAFSERLLSSLRGKISAKEYERLQWIWNEGKWLEEFVNNVLAVTRLSSASQTMEPEPLDVLSVVSEVMESLYPQVNERGQSFDVRLVGLPLIYADAWAVKRLFMNLLNNAVRHGRSGGIIEIGGEDAGDMVRFWVKDDGPGVSEKDLPHIFEKFYTDTKGRRGSGLGLAIARDVVEAHGGLIWAESKEGRGATFFVTLPKVVIEERT